MYRIVLDTANQPANWAANRDKKKRKKYSTSTNKNRMKKLSIGKKKKWLPHSILLWSIYFHYHVTLECLVKLIKRKY